MSDIIDLVTVAIRAAMRRAWQHEEEKSFDSSPTRRAARAALEVINVREIKRAAWCEGRDAAAAEIDKSWPEADAFEIVRALKSPYEEGK